MAARGAVLGAGSCAPPAELVQRTRPAYRIATGATGAPVAPVKGSGVADSRNA